MNPQVTVVTVSLFFSLFLLLKFHLNHLILHSEPKFHYSTIVTQTTTAFNPCTEFNSTQLTFYFQMLFRFICVYVLTSITNSFRMKRINLQEQFIMAYGGLRGGVGFSLLKMIDSKVIPAADIFVTTGLMVVMATVWIQGSL